MILREIKNMYVSKFQQIEYLESTGTQYIDTEVYANLNTSVDVKFCFTEIFSDNAIISSDMGSSEFKSFTLEYYYDKINSWGQYGIVFSIDGYSAIAYKGTTERALAWFDVNASKRGLVINNVFYSSRHQPSNFTSNYPLFMFAYGRNGVPIIFGKSRITYLKIYNNGTLIRDFIPVRVGSVGYMYDRVSKRLFGNKGTGNFVLGQDVDSELQQIYQNKLIEGVDYETADWLKGDGIAYINTNYLLDFDDIKTSVFRTYNTNTQVFEGTRYSSRQTPKNGAGTVIGYGNDNNNYGSFFSPNGEMARWNNNIPINVENTVVMSKNGITLNGTKISTISPCPIVGSRFESVTPYLIFASWIHNWQIDNRRQKVDYKSFEIEGKLHLVPCQLLRPISRNLDAQCKERQVGDCGMIDLISGKFYGNVANSGTFTVENDTENNE